MTAMLVAPEDVGGRADGITATLAREEIEEALAADAPLDLLLDVRADDGRVENVKVSWERDDLESLLSRIEYGAIMLSFEPEELRRALDEPDFEGHGIREAVLLTVAAASASAALAAGTASGQLLEAGGGGAASAVAVPGHGEATTAGVLATAAVAHDEAGLVARGIEAPAPADTGSGSSFELPAVDSGTAAAIGGLAGAGLLIVGAGFLARRQRPGAA
jgi:hypothetical protein